MSGDFSFRSSWLRHTQLLDSALPIGAFSHSFGLETLVQDGRIDSVSELKTYLENTLLGSWASSDALQIKAVYTLSKEDVWRLDSYLDASRVSRETREGMRKMGRQALKLASAIHPDLDFSSLISAIGRNQCPGSWPLVYAIWSKQLGVTLERAVTGYLYSCCAAALANAVRLSLIGQTVSQRLLAELLPEIETAWARVSERDPFDFSTALPILEIAQMRHESLEARLFMS